MTQPKDRLDRARDRLLLTMAGALMGLITGINPTLAALLRERFEDFEAAFYEQD